MSIETRAFLAFPIGLVLLAGQRGPAAAPAVEFWDHFIEVSQTDPGGAHRDLQLLLFDADGDGRSELFLGFVEACGTGGCPWWVYSPTRRPGEVRYLGDAGFSPAGYRFDAAAHELTFCWHLSAAECALGTLVFRGSRMINRNGGTCLSEDERCTRQLDAIRRWQRQAPPRYRAVLPARVLEWRDENGRVRREGMPDLDHLRVIPPLPSR